MNTTYLQALQAIVNPRPVSTFRCPQCGSENVQCTAWVYANTGEETGGDPPCDKTYYCEDCAEIDGADPCIAYLCHGPDGVCLNHSEPVGPFCKPSTT